MENNTHLLQKFACNLKRWDMDYEGMLQQFFKTNYNVQYH